MSGEDESIHQPLSTDEHRRADRAYDAMISARYRRANERTNKLTNHAPKTGRAVLAAIVDRHNGSVAQNDPEAVEGNRGILARATESFNMRRKGGLKRKGGGNTDALKKAADKENGRTR